MKTDQAHRIAALTERLARLMMTEAHTDNLLPVHWEALRYLAVANRFSRTLAGMTRYLGLTKGTVSQTIKTLEAKGLLSKEVDTKDRRSNRLTLSSKGKTALSNDPLNGAKASIDALPRKTRDQLEQGLSALLTRRLIEQDRQAFGQCRKCVYFTKRHPEHGGHFCELLEEKLSPADARQICFEQRASG